MDVVTFAAQVQALGTYAEVSRTLSQLTAAAGFPTHVISPVPTDHMPVEAGGFLVQNWPVDWHETYIAEGFGAFDPVPRAASIVTTPITIAEIREGKAGFIPDPRAERIWEKGAELNRDCGLLVPIFGPQGYRGIVCFAGPGPDPDAATRAALHLAAIYAHNRVRALSAENSSGEFSLSSRETAVLKGVSLGFSDSEISENLEISIRTVRFHLQNARRKLHAANREQAVAIASAQGFI